MKRATTPQGVMSMRSFVIAGLSVWLAAAPVSAATYNVAFDGAVIDLTGTIEIAAIGTFSAREFESQVSAFSITATGNDGSSHIFDQDNSEWGALTQFPAGGTNVYLDVTPTNIEIRAPSGSTSDTQNLFLVGTGSVPINSFLPNLALGVVQMRYISAPPNSQFFEDVSMPIVLGTVSPVPIPAAAWLFGSALIGLGLLSRRNERTSLGGGARAFRKVGP